MKRFSTILLAVLVLVSAFTFTSCDKDSAFAIFDNAMKKTQALDSVELVMSTVSEISGDGTTIKTPLEYKIKATNLKSDKPVVLATLTASVLGIQMNTEIYCENDYVYLSSFGTKTKMPLASADEEYDMSSIVKSAITALPEELFANVELSLNGDGSKSFTLTVTDEQFKQLFADLLRDSSELSLNNDSGLDSLTVSDCHISVVIDKNGYIQKYEVGFKMDMNATVIGADISFSASVTSVAEFINPGKAVTITPPDGYANYPESGMGFLDSGDFDMPDFSAAIDFSKIKF